jgi:hypothetical protein
MDYDAYDAILHMVFKRTQEDAWFKPTEENVSAGVCLRVETNHFRVFPYEVSSKPDALPLPCLTLSPEPLSRSLRGGSQGFEPCHCREDSQCRRTLGTRITVS